MKINVGISNRHIHLSKEIANLLFGENYEFNILKKLSQIGQYAYDECVTIKSEKGVIEKVRVLGPLRNKTQVEISKTDAYTLGINPPVRNSGDLENSESIIIIGPEKELFLENSVIIANRHIHLNNTDADNMNLKNNEIVEIKVNTLRGGVFDNVVVRVDDNFVKELHIDTDDANAFMLKNNDEVEIIRKD